MANTHKALRTIHVAPALARNAPLHEVDARNRAGIANDTRVLAPGEHFNPSDAHMDGDEVKRLEAAGAIAPLEGARQDSGDSGDRKGPSISTGEVPGKTSGTDALTAAARAPAPAGPGAPAPAAPVPSHGEGSGATRQGERQTTPAGIDQGAPKK